MQGLRNNNKEGQIPYIFACSRLINLLTLLSKQDWFVQWYARLAAYMCLFSGLRCTMENG